MTNISEIIEEILVEWAYRVHDGMPNPKNAQHIHELRESMEELNLPNNVIYQVIENLNTKGMIANPITLKNYFEKNQGLDEVGGVEYLVKLTRFSSSVKQAIDYAKIVHENYVKRELIKISHYIKDDTLNTEEDKTSDLIIEDAEKLLFDLAERGSFSQSFMKFNLALDQSINMAEQAMKNDQGIVGVPTGLTDLDEKLGGLHKSDLVIIAGRPSMGKTALATNIAYHAAKNIQLRGTKSSIAFFLLWSFGPIVLTFISRLRGSKTILIFFNSMFRSSS